jgi:hypothetical protein
VSPGRDDRPGGQYRRLPGVIGGARNQAGYRISMSPIMREQFMWGHMVRLLSK